MARLLNLDTERRVFTALVRMEPGSTYPEHDHDGPEECLVIEGELFVGDELLLKSGDYQYNPPGTRHAVQSTKTGCVILISGPASLIGA
jgi:quercetin dioxygenase-like cupin family protein